MQGLYPIIDVDAVTRVGFPVVEFAQRVLLARPAVCQLRAKHTSPRDTLALLRALVPAFRAANVLLFANDRPDLAELAGCDGVHVGQSDLPLAQVRQFAPRLRVGVSTHNLLQLEQALTEKPDYVAFGPVFPTGSKLNADPAVGLDALAAAAVRARAAATDIVAIGGITLKSALAVAQTGAMAAVISALIPDTGNLDDVEARAREWHQTLLAPTP